MPATGGLGSAAELWAQLDVFARGMEPAVAKAFKAMIRRVRTTIPQEVLDEVVRTGDINPILERIDWTNFKLALRNSMLDAASHSTLPFEVKFDVLNPYAIRAIQTTEFTLIQGLTAEVAAGLRQFLTLGLQLGLNPVDTARNLRAIIGLTPKQAQSVLNYRQLLTGGAKGQPYREALRRMTRDGRFDRTVLRAIEEKVPLKPEQVARQVERFEQRLLNARAETIARTETMNALHEGQRLRWQQAIDAGQVQESELRRFWHTARDERVCPICARIPGANPEGVDFNTPFDVPDGEPIMGPTAHPNCRCVVFIRIVFAKNHLPLYNLRQLAAELSGLRRAA